MRDLGDFKRGIPSMRHLSLRTTLVAALAATTVAHAGAQDPVDHGSMDHHMHMMAIGEDARTVLDFPPPLRDHMLANMRGHLQTLSEILGAVAAGDYPAAANLADARLGVASPAATGCRLPESGAGPAPLAQAGDMDAMMGRFMPEDMRKLGMAMHLAATGFAIEARKAAGTGDGRAAGAALAQVTQRCVTCHSAYRLR